MDYKKLGLRIKDERIKLGLTQAKLAEEIDISDAYLGQIERGERSLTLNTLVRLVNRLGVTIDYLLSNYVDSSNENIVDQFKQIISKQSTNRQQMAINVLRTIFTQLDDEL